jgi:hypothetical protein
VQWPRSRNRPWLITLYVESHYNFKDAEKLSCTRLVERFTFQRNSQTIHLINTPGFGRDGSDALLLEDVAGFLNQSYLSGIQLNGIVYLHPISAPRVQGSTITCLRIIQKICGPTAQTMILLGSSMWDKEDSHTALMREQELIENPNFWGDLVDRGGKTFRFYNNNEPALIACDYIIQRRQKMMLALQH